MFERFQVMDATGGFRAVEFGEGGAIVWRGPLRREWADAQLDLEERMGDARALSVRQLFKHGYQPEIDEVLNG